MDASNERTVSSAANKPDVVLDAYREWLNEMLFANKGEGDEVAWIGEGRWMMWSSEGPGIFLIQMDRAEVVQK